MTRYHVPHQPDSLPPVLLGRLWGWRAFRLGGEVFQSPQQGLRWTKHTLQATCYLGHVAPGESCSCGFYVYATLEDLMGNIGLYGTQIVGLVSAWGKISLAEFGYRAQWVRLEHLFVRLSRPEREAIAMRYLTLEHAPRISHLSKLPQLNLPQKWAKRIQLDKMVIPRGEVPTEVIEEFMGAGAIPPEVARRIARKRQRQSRPPRRQFPHSNHVASRYCSECDGSTPWTVHLVPITSADASAVLQIHQEYRCSICGHSAA